MKTYKQKYKAADVDTTQLNKEQQNKTTNCSNYQT